MTSPLFSTPEMLFPTEPLQQNSTQVPQWYQDAYSRNDVVPVGTSSLPPGVLPDVIVSGSDDTSFVPNFNQGSFDSQPIEKKATADTNLNITKDKVFDKPLTSAPDVVDRAARALARDTEGMLMYLALMKADSESFQSVADTATRSALQTAVARETEVMQERLFKRFQTMNMSDEAVTQVMEFFQVFNKAMFGSSNNQNAGVDTGVDTGVNTNTDRVVNTGFTTGTTSSSRNQFT